MKNSREFLQILEGTSEKALKKGLGYAFRKANPTWAEMSKAEIIAALVEERRQNRLEALSDYLAARAARKDRKVDNSQMELFA